jgi:integrase
MAGFDPSTEAGEADELHVTDIKNPWTAALTRAAEILRKDKKKEEADSLSDFRFLVLRYTGGSWLGMGGASLGEAQRFLGHVSIKMTLRYAPLCRVPQRRRSGFSNEAVK